MIKIEYTEADVLTFTTFPALARAAGLNYRTVRNYLSQKIARPKPYVVKLINESATKLKLDKIKQLTEDRQAAQAV